MNFRISSLAFLAGTCLSLSGCGLGSDASIGDESAGQQAAGGDTSSGGSATGSGGNGPGSGGATTGPGGTSTGGVTGAGGATSTGGSGPGGAGGTTGVQCGKNVCGDKEYCCNESCGICAPMGSACIEVFCSPPDGGTTCAPVPCPSNSKWSQADCSCVPGGGCAGGIVPCPSNSTWSTTLCTCVPNAPTCTADADCRLVADYCGGCTCLALGPNQKLPSCTGTQYECFADPCMTKTAACSNGACVAQ